MVEALGAMTEGGPGENRRCPRKKGTTEEKGRNGTSRMPSRYHRRCVRTLHHPSLLCTFLRASSMASSLFPSPFYLSHHPYREFLSARLTIQTVPILFHFASAPLTFPINPRLRFPDSNSPCASSRDRRLSQVYSLSEISKKLLQLYCPRCVCWFELAHSIRRH